MSQRLLLRHAKSSVHSLPLHPQYRTVIQPLLSANASVHFTSKVLSSIVVPGGEKWDNVVIVRYETFEGFREMVESEVYKKDA